MFVKYAVIAPDELMEMWTVSAYSSASSGETNEARDKKWTFAQKNNNCSSMRVTLRCGLVFAPSVTTGRSQRAVREALQMTVGVMERFSEA